MPSSRSAGARAPRSALAPFVALALGLAGAAGCAFPTRAPEPIDASASAAFARARREERRAAPGWRERARAEAEAALGLDPEWVAPARFLDELDREDLRGPDALARRLDLVRADPARPDELYLAGRLEGRLGRARHEEALRLDPSFAWGHHGLAWIEFEAGNPVRARLHGQRALAAARDAFERAFFAQSLARYELAGRRVEAAVEVLRAELARDPASSERVAVEVLLARAELASEEDEEREAGFWRALRLLRGEELEESEVADLAVALLARADGLPFRAALPEIDAALAARRSPARDGFRARLQAERGAPALALALIGDGVGAADARGAAVGMEPAAWRAARFACGDGPRAIEDWLAVLPHEVLDADGLPRRAELRALVLAARAAPEDGAAAALGDALVAAGWFEEARGQAVSLAARDPAAALALDRRAAEASALLAGIGDLLDAVDAGRAWLASGASPDRANEGAKTHPTSLALLLGALEGLFALHSDGALGDAPDLVHSPRLDFGAFASVVHPGPSFSAADERAGLGARGSPVGGLAAELLRRGRFGVFGESVGGGGPDGTVLRLVAFEERSGELLGREFGGTVAWCEGTDVPSRPVRRGAAISGAALHEGFWIDLDVVRSELAHWSELERAFLDGPAAENGARAARALAVRGPELAPDAGRDARAALLLPLGEGDRIRLAVLAERSASARGRVTLEELLEATARHEEGHLVDRGRFLPLTKDPLGALALLARAGFTPAGVARILETRAELVALATADDPRFVLADCVDGLESDNGVTPHAQAYADLMEGFLAILARDVERYAELDPRRPLVFQLHVLRPEEVRAVAHELARAQDVARR